MIGTNQINFMKSVIVMALVLFGLSRCFAEQVPYHPDGAGDPASPLVAAELGLGNAGIALPYIGLPGPATRDSAVPPLTGPYALIAGGSKGIGYGIAESLARRGYNLVLIARHLDSLVDAKTRLESSYGIHVEVLVYDLAKETSAAAIGNWCTERAIPLRMLCNVAGLGGSQDYLSFPLDSLRYMVRLNIESAMALTLTLLPLLEKNAPAYILNVSSMAGFAPIPSKNIYSATKSALTFFSYSLRYQLKKKVSV